MKENRIVVSVLAAALLPLLTGISLADEDREKNPRFKGVELYSWKDDQKKWVFVMLDGTNRVKSKEEIKGSKNRIKGVALLKKAFGKLARNEQVIWSHRAKGFEFPPKKLRTEISTAAKTAEIELSTLKPKE